MNDKPLYPQPSSAPAERRIAPPRSPKGLSRISLRPPICRQIVRNTLLYAGAPLYGCGCGRACYVK
jgi:hypothetical protein